MESRRLAKSALDDFFVACRVKKSETMYTHTGLDFPLGKFNITSDKLSEFYNLYSSAIKAGVPVHLTERHLYEDPSDLNTKYGPVLIDIDLKFDSSVKGRQVTEKHIYNIVNLYSKEYQRLLNGQKNTFKAFVFQREGAYLKTETNEVKDGIHIMFPFLITRGNLDHYVRKRVIDSISENPDLFRIPGNVNNLEESIDKSVICKNNWLMYGSRKPRCAPYELVSIYKMDTSKQVSLNDFMEFGLDLGQIFSIRNSQISDIIPYVNVSVQNTVESFLRDPYFSSVRSKTKNSKLSYDNIMKPQFKQLNDSDLEFVKKITKLLNAKRATEWESWLHVGWALKNMDPVRLEESFIEFSSKSLKNNFNEAVCRKDWASFSQRVDGFNLSNLKIWAKEDSLDDYNDIIASNIQELYLQGLTCTHADLSTVIFEMYKDEFKCTDIGKQEWYEFKNHRWCHTHKGNSLWKKITTVITNQYMKMANDKNMYINNHNDPNNTLVQQALKVATQLKNNSFINSVLNMCANKFYDPEFKEFLNTKEHLICFENGVFDFSSSSFREGRPEDYLSFSTGTYYIEIDKSDTEYIQMKRFFRQIFPSKQKRKYVFRVLGSNLHGEIFYELFHFWTGKGSNGKSTLFSFLEMALGDYFGKFNSTFWTGKSAGSSDVKPDIKYNKNKRMVSSDEPEENAPMNSSQVKVTTGGDSTVYRGLWEEQSKFKPQWKIHLLCNDIPPFNVRDQGTWRRVRCIECTSRFVQYPNPENPNEFPVDFSLKVKIRKWIPIFASYLVKQCVSFLKESALPKCEEVESFTKEYQQDTDYMLEFENFCVKVDPEYTTKVTIVRKTFTEWWKDNKGTMKMPNSKVAENYLSDKYSKTKKGIKGIQVGFNINAQAQVNYDNETDLL